MPSFRRRASVIDTDQVEKPKEKPDADPAKALALEEAEAEAAEAEAVAAAARAKAKALKLRREAAEAELARDAATADEAVAEPEIDVTEVDGDEIDDPVALEEERKRRLRWLPRISWKAVAAGFAMLLIGALVAASGYMVFQHRLAQREQQEYAEYTAAARQGVVTLMSLDFNKAKEDVQRIIDNTTGQFKEDFEAQAEMFSQVAKDSKVVTEVTVNATAVKEMTDSTAQVIVSATSNVTNAAGAKQEPRSWRLMVDLAREGEQIKMAKVEFVP